MKAKAMSTEESDKFLEMCADAAETDEEREAAEALLRARKARRERGSARAVDTKKKPNDPEFSVGKAQGRQLNVNGRAMSEAEYIDAKMGLAPRSTGVVRSGTSLELNPMTPAEVEAACRRLGI